MDVVNGFSSV